MKTLVAAAIGSLVLIASGSPAPGQKVSIKGSNTFGEELGPALIKEFQVKYPEIQVELETRGSGSGIAALLAGGCDIASSSRPLNEDELRMAKSRGIRFENHVVGYYGIAVVVQDQHPVKALSDVDVESIFTGEVKNWKDVGGPDLPIRLYIPDSDAGTYLGFQELAMSRKPYSREAIHKTTYHEIGRTIAADPGGVGFVSLDIMRELNLQGLLVNGIHPSTIAVTEGLYPYARMIRLLTRKGETSREARLFIRFTQSREGQDILEKTGFVPRVSTPLDYGGLAF